ncbi:MAG: YncE family protein, partial [Bacteroidota bacterium]
MKTILFRILFIGFGLALPPSLLAQDYYVYVTCESEDEVDLVKFDGEKAEVLEKIPVGYNPTEIEGPHGITVSPDGKYWFLSMAHGVPFGRVYKFTTGDNKLLAYTELGLFPASMQISRANGLLYVVNFNLHGKMEPSSVSVVDPETMSEIKKITTGAMPHGSRISADGLKHYSVGMMSGELFEINTISLEVDRKLNLDQADGMKMDHSQHQGMDHSQHQGMNQMDKQAGMKHSMVKPTWVIPHPDGQKVYVAGNGNNEVLEVNTQDWKITHRFPTGKGPYNVELSPDGKLMVVTYKSEGSTGIWDLESKKELANIKNTRKVSHGIAISSDNRYAFVSVEGIGGEPGALDVIDLKKLEKVASADVGKQAG